MIMPGRCRRLRRDAALLTVTLAAMCSTGCLTPSIRYTRSGTAGRRSTASSCTSRKVPVGWDYRKQYSVPAGRLEQVARGYLGTRYRYGGMSRGGTDCSGFVCMVYRDVSHVKLPHSTATLRTMGRKIAMADARSGDLVFFRRGAFGRVGHVGLYLRDGIFIHASTKHGVICSSLDDGYYKRNFVEIRRLFK
jgi:probable lipoprotein NlpC